STATPRRPDSRTAPCPRHGSPQRVQAPRPPPRHPEGAPAPSRRRAYRPKDATRSASGPLHAPGTAGRAGWSCTPDATRGSGDFRYLEIEAGNRGVEPGAVRAAEPVVALHVAGRPAQYAVALVLVHIARSQRRLLPHHPLAHHLVVAGDRVVDVPVPPEQLRRLVTHVLDPDPVGEHVARLQRVRLLGEVRRAGCDADTFRDTVVQRDRHRRAAERGTDAAARTATPCRTRRQDRPDNIRRHAAGDYCGVKRNRLMTISTSRPSLGDCPLWSQRFMCTGIGFCGTVRAGFDGRYSHRASCRPSCGPWPS